MSIPYLVSVADPYDAASPVHTWGPFSLSPQRLTARLGVPFGPIRVARNGSGRVSAVEIGNVSMSGREAMRRLRLRSTWFDVGRLTLTGSRSSVVYGRRAKLTARAQGMGDASLQELTPSGWRTLRRVATGGSVEVKPRAYTIYRLTAGRVRGPEVGVSVAPVVRAHPESGTLLAGRILPRPGGEVTVSRFLAGG